MATIETVRTLQWKYDDGGRWDAGFRPRHVGDCVTRAIAIATGLPYTEVVELVNAMGRERGRRMYKSKPAGLLPSDVEDLLSGLGWRYVAMPPGMHLSPGELPDAPILIARVGRGRRGHMCAVIDGTIRDIWDSSRMRSQKPDAKTHNRRQVRGVYLLGSNDGDN